MTPTPATQQPSPPKNVNRLGLAKEDYKGSPSTLCPGCGHDAITDKIIKAAFEMGVDPYRVAKLSGIGCSSKAPAYFISRSYGFNAVHGRMPSIATGTALANRTLLNIGMSGDGDTASIGIGQFVHTVRRNVQVVYIIANNGTYGLTKGQFSATADVGSTLRTGPLAGTANTTPPIDCCALAVELGCGFVARSFAGDPKQLMAILKAAFAHKGTAVLDVISPCVTFNDHEGSTKSYKYTKEHDIPLHELNFIPSFEPLQDIDIEPGTTKEVEFEDGSHVILKKLGIDYDPTNRLVALQTLQTSSEKGEIVTGLLYINPKLPDFTQALNLVDEPLASLQTDRLRPPKAALDELMQELK